QYTDIDLNAAYDALTTKSKEQMEAAAAIMEACACYLWSNRLVRVNEDCLAVLISNYPRSNPSADLSVDALCERFHLSRNKLYKISRDSYGTSIAAYVRKQRVNHAASLLRSGCTVADAAIRSGFVDYNYFSEIFKKETGILPGKYSRMNAAEKQ
ncbi:MAG: helix-turn-helix domain-containing protein, partial [Eubacteriales bacterium]